MYCWSSTSILDWTYVVWLHPIRKYEPGTQLAHTFIVFITTIQVEYWKSQQLFNRSQYNTIENYFELEERRQCWSILCSPVIITQVPIRNFLEPLYTQIIYHNQNQRIKPNWLLCWECLQFCNWYSHNDHGSP